MACWLSLFLFPENRVPILPIGFSYRLLAQKAVTTLTTVNYQCMYAAVYQATWCRRGRQTSIGPASVRGAESRPHHARTSRHFSSHKMAILLAGASSALSVSCS